ncbi:KDO2-lipid IV(A) lauroyltransferase [Aliiroseovarius halocynthiae]|uniref:Lysophospholipid acyltransferase family protein n=1 Tax=Aliiroseovarius halocynthiae TaxID=985055 RepID=A0A545SUI3_9RHOB|nr:lysophospholipid acyltransferase family protein [Aliiroseovarius halocynthiae]TQV68613.1 lysophospholipid acyltransferase family protein [Aliiroseovarius halocynthiae]SMR71026.1 KDO2-lipid IV(A) lauroyltransferase [Aliiroseovarius halocynthiae]
MVQEKRGLGPYVTNLALASMLNLPRFLPYTMRLPVVGWFAAHVIGPVAGYDKRIRKNLALTCPEMTPDEVKQMERAVLHNTGRFLAEMWSGNALFNRMKGTQLSGPGVIALEKAKADRRPIIATSGHFGNYDAARAVLVQAGFDTGALYRPMSNAYFNESYIKRMEGFEGEAFEQSRRGMGSMVKHLRKGGLLAILLDQREDQGVKLRFFGQPAMTTLAIAEMALKYDTLFIPVFAIRKENGLDFDIVVDEPIAHTDPETMMQEFNDRFEARVRQNMDQFLWIHNRWQMPGSA